MAFNLNHNKLGFLIWGIRIDNVIFFLGFPLLGAFLVIPDLSWASLQKLTLFGILSAMLLTQTFIVNDLGDSVLNPEEPKYRPRHALKHPEILNFKQLVGLCVILSILSVAGIFLLSGGAGIFSLSAWAISIIYSHPRLTLKKRLFLPELAHLLFAGALFLSGWKLFQPVSLESLLLTLFFGLVLTAGDLVNQIEDFEREIIVGLRTSAIIFGKRPVSRFALWLFYFSSLYLFGLALAGSIQNWIKWPGLILIIIWTGTIFSLRKKDPLKNISKFRRWIRLIYALFSFFLVLTLILRKI